MNVPAKVKIIVIDLDPESGLGPLLRDMIVTSEHPLDCSITSISNKLAMDVLGNRLSALSSEADADLIFVIMPYDITALLDFLRTMKNGDITLPPIIVAYREMESEQAIDLLKAGVVDFISPPFRIIDILPRIWRLLARMSADAVLMNVLREKAGLRQIIGRNAAFLAEIGKIPLIARSNSAVLILGETGTGKELCGRAIHYLGERSGFSFVPVNCGAIPVDLLENELFGHRKGAYTGAHESRTGLINEADGGTIFLDEIESLPLSAQVKLLRFLQDKEYRQLGSTQVLRSDVRVIAATNIRLDLAVDDGRFRRDLYYRLNVIPLSLPPLKERREDIPLLARHFLKKQNAETGRDLVDFSAGALRKLMCYDWPGNVRELENVIERAVVFSKGTSIVSADIMLAESREEDCLESFSAAKAKVVDQFEIEYIRSLLISHEGNVSQASRTAGKNRRAFWELIRKHGIDVRRFRLQQT